MLQVLETRQTGKRLSKWRRSENPLPHVLTDRDRAILAAVAEYRLLSRAQIQKLLGFGAVTRVNFRLSKLFHNGYLRRHYVPVLHGSSQAIYTLDRLGVPAAAERLGKDVGSLWRPKENLHPFFLAHQLAVNDVRVGFELAARPRKEHSLVTWLGEQEAKDRFFFGAEWKTLTPDAFGRYQVRGSVLSFFLEVDMGTAPTRRFKEKVDRYVAYDASGRYAERHTGQRFRVLVVASSPQRLTNLQRATADITHRYFWFTTLHQLQSQGPLAPIWITASRQNAVRLFPSDPKEVHAQ